METCPFVPWWTGSIEQPEGIRQAWSTSTRIGGSLQSADGRNAWLASLADHVVGAVTAVHDGAVAPIAQRQRQPA